MFLLLLKILFTSKCDHKIPGVGTILASDFKPALHQNIGGPEVQGHHRIKGQCTGSRYGYVIEVWSRFVDHDRFIYKNALAGAWLQ